MTALILLMIFAEFGWNYARPTARDFVSFWGASQFALAGHPELAYDNEALHALQLKVAAFDGGEMPFPYAPSFLLLVAPFGLLPFPIALIAWSLTGYVIYLLAANRLNPGRAWVAAAFPPVFANAAIGQNGFIMAALFFLGLSLIDRRPRLSGLLLGCLILKPQLALMLPVATLAGRKWQVIVNAALSAVLVIAAGLFIYGPAATAAWLDQMPLYVTIAREGLVGWHKLISVYAAARQVGAPETLASALHGAFALAAAVAVWRIWASSATWPAKFAILSAASLLASPYLYIYDALILIPAFVYLVERRAPVALIALAWLLPIATMIQVASGAWPINVGPLPAIILFILVWRTAQAEERAMVGN